MSMLESAACLCVLERRELTASLAAFQTELLETFGLNVHRIDKDVQRCDRNYWYFTVDNLEKLRNVMCT